MYKIFLVLLALGMGTYSSGSAFGLILRLTVEHNQAPQIARKERLQILMEALGFAINSLNTEDVSVFDFQKNIRGLNQSNGQLATTNGQIEIDLDPFLPQEVQRKLLDIIDKDPYRCRFFGAPSQFRVRVDSLIHQIFSIPANYYSVMRLNDSRQSFESSFGVEAEFRDFSNHSRRNFSRAPAEHVHRVIIQAGESGIVNETSPRFIALQTKERSFNTTETDRHGRVWSVGRNRKVTLARTGENSSRERQSDEKNIFLHPREAHFDAHEEIWELPNGFRAFALRDTRGRLVPEAPVSVVSRGIINPSSCLDCHDTGYLVASNNYTDVREDVTDAQLRGLFSGFDAFKRIENEANLRLTNARKSAGTSIRKVIPRFLSTFQSDLSREVLAEELGMTVGRLEARLNSNIIKHQLGASIATRQVFPRAFLENQRGEDSYFCIIRGATAAELQQARQPLPEDESQLSRRVESPPSFTPQPPVSRYLTCSAYCEGDGTTCSIGCNFPPSRPYCNCLNTGRATRINPRTGRPQGSTTAYCNCG